MPNVVIQLSPGCRLNAIWLPPIAIWLTPRQRPTTQTLLAVDASGKEVAEAFGSALRMWRSDPMASDARMRHAVQSGLIRRVCQVAAAKREAHAAWLDEGKAHEA